MKPDRVLTDGVEFSGDAAALARANLWLRTAGRVLVRVARFRARTFAELERHAARVEWSKYLPPSGEVAFRVTAKKSRLYHTGAIVERLLRVVNRSRAAAAGSENETGRRPAQLFVVRIARDECTISADSSGEHLHKRGYRQAIAKAPLRETLAATMLLASRWNLRSPLIDPFCGSGTIPIEAVLLACGTAPGLRREFSFTNWPSISGEELQREREKAGSSMNRDLPAIAGFDRDDGAIAAAVANAARANVQSHVTFRRQPLSDLAPPGDRGWLICNPPYGLRVGERRGLRDLYARLGDIVRERCHGWRIVLLSADAGLERATRLPFTTVLKTTNGGVPVRLVIAIVE